jgi:hypothetical protein
MSRMQTVPIDQPPIRNSDAKDFDPGLHISLDRRVHVWVGSPHNQYVFEHQVPKDFRYCPCLQHYISPDERARNRCNKLCG